MYIQIKDEKISLDFNPNISVSINGPDSFYYVEVREYKKNEDQSLFVFGGHISNNNPFKTHILPLIEQDVNTGKNFASLRQIYNSLILAVWFKQKFKESFYKNYIDQKKIQGIDLADKNIKEKITVSVINFCGNRNIILG